VGPLVWQGAGKLGVETRSGNTAKPGVGWSAWAAPGKQATAGGGTTGGGIASPPGRYLQFRVSLPDDGALRRVPSTTCRRNRHRRSRRSRSSWPAARAQPTLKEAGGQAAQPDR
jgi:hypothetical protein